MTHPTTSAPTMKKNSEKSQVYENPTYIIIDLGREDDVITGSALEHDGSEQETPGFISW